MALSPDLLAQLNRDRNGDGTFGNKEHRDAEVTLSATADYDEFGLPAHTRHRDNAIRLHPSDCYCGACTEAIDTFPLDTAERVAEAAAAGRPILNETGGRIALVANPGGGYGDRYTFRAVERWSEPDGALWVTDDGDVNGEAEKRAIVIDPPGCGCTDCGVRYSIPLDSVGQEHAERAKNGVQIINRTFGPIVLVEGEYGHLELVSYDEALRSAGTPVSVFDKD